MESTIIENQPDIDPAAFAGMLALLGTSCHELHIQPMFVGTAPFEGTITVRALSSWEIEIDNTTLSYKLSPITRPEV